MPYLYANGFTATLSAGISDAATSLAVVTGQGARAPAVAAPDVMPCVLYEAGVGYEFVNVTAHAAASDTFTIARAVDSYQNGAATALVFTAAAVLTGVIPKKALEGAQPYYLPFQASVPLAKAGGLQLMGYEHGGRPMVKLQVPAGDDYNLQPSMATSQVAFYKPGTGTAVGVSPGLPLTWSGTTTITHPAMATTAPAILNAMRRTRAGNVVTTANQVLGAFSPQAVVWRGNAAGLGGFHVVLRVATATIPAASRWFIGLSTLFTGVHASAEPSAAAGAFIAFGADAADTNLSIMRRDGTAAVTKTALTTVQARTAGRVYDVILTADPNGTGITVEIKEVTTGGANVTLHKETFTTNIPLSTAMLGVQCVAGNAALTTANAVVLDVASIYVESDN